MSPTKISLDQQIVAKRCPACDVNFTAVRGTVFVEDSPTALYLIGLHGHRPQGRVAHLAIAVMDQLSTPDHPCAAAMDVVATSTEFGFVLINWDLSPWRHELYLGEMLSPDQVRSSPLRPLFFHIAGHVVRDLDEVVAYFADDSGTSE